MPLIRKIIEVGKTSRGIILPKSWLEYFEQQNEGRPIESVAVEVNRHLVITPILLRKETVEGPT